MYEPNSVNDDNFHEPRKLSRSCPLAKKGSTLETLLNGSLADLLRTHGLEAEAEQVIRDRDGRNHQVDVLVELDEHAVAIEAEFAPARTVIADAPEAPAGTPALLARPSRRLCLYARLSRDAPSGSGKPCQNTARDVQRIGVLATVSRRSRDTGSPVPRS